jgi:hypothetical protein
VNEVHKRLNPSEDFKLASDILIFDFLFSIVRPAKLMKLEELDNPAASFFSDELEDYNEALRGS